MGAAAAKQKKKGKSYNSQSCSGNVDHVVVESTENASGETTDQHEDKCKTNGGGGLQQVSDVVRKDVLKTYVVSYNKVTTSHNVGPISFSVLNLFLMNGQVHVDKFEMEIIEIAFVKLKNEPVFNGNCMWLWHGTRLELLGSILENGLQPPPRGTNGLAGDGIYFADRASKSAQYCYKGNKRPPEGCLLLCKVHLGEEYNAEEASNDFSRAPHGFDSVVCNGKYIPSPDEELMFENAVFPVGRTIRNPEDACKTGAGKNLQYNEFVVYDSAQVQVKYLLHFKFI